MARMPSEKDILDGRLKPVYFLYGDEALLMERDLKLFWEHVVDPSMVDFNRDSFHMEDVDSASFFALLSSYPMMAERRLVVLRGLEQSKTAFRNDLVTYLAQPSESSVLVMLAAKTDKRQKFWKTLISKTESIEYQTPKDHQLAEWLMNEARAQGRSMDNRAAQELAMRLGGANLHMAVQELDKLFLLHPAEETITLEALGEALGIDPGASPFAFIDALLARRKQQAMAMLPSLLQQPDAEFFLVPNLIRSFGRLWFVRSLLDAGVSQGEIPGMLKVSGFALRTTFSVAGKWSRPMAEEACELLNQTDVAMKGGSALKASHLLTQLIVKLCRIQ